MGSTVFTVCVFSLSCSTAAYVMYEHALRLQREVKGPEALRKQVHTVIPVYGQSTFRIVRFQ